MTRFFGAVGYAKSTRVDGIVEEVITEREYYGDELRLSRFFQDNTDILGEIKQQSRISVLSDAYALENYEDIRYVVKAGTPWTVDTVSVERPRLVMTLSDKYNGPRPEVTP